MNKVGFEIRFVREDDKEFWFSLDKHLPEREFAKKVRDGQGYVLLDGNQPAAILRYNLFWDNTPLCNLLFVKRGCRRKGFGEALMNNWESEMLAAGYEFVLVSTQSDEEAQHFYRKLGYKDCGTLNLPNQPEELFLIKRLSEIRLAEDN